MRFSLQMHTLRTIDDWVALAQRVEEIGLDELHIAERTDYSYPTWPTLFMMAEHTQRLVVGPGVTNPYSRHPTVTAKMAATLYDYSGGRAVLGIGQGDLWQFGQLGFRPERPLQALREAVQLIRRFLTGDTSAFDGEIFSAAEGFDFPSWRPAGSVVPIFVGSRSPGGMTVAGEAADELHMPLCVAPEMIVLAQEKLDKGMQKAGRNSDAVSLACSPQLSLSHDRDAAIKDAQIEIGRFIKYLDAPCELLGFDAEEVARLIEAYSKEDNDYLFKNVNQKYLDAFAVAGTPHEVIEQIERLAELGVEHVTFNEPGPKLEEGLMLLEKEVLPHFAG